MSRHRTSILASSAAGAGAPPSRTARTSIIVPKRMVTRLIIRAHGFFHIFSESLICSSPIRTELEGDTLIVYNATTRKVTEVVQQTRPDPLLSAPPPAFPSASTENGMLIAPLTAPIVRSAQAESAAKRLRVTSATDTNRCVDFVQGHASSLTLPTSPVSVKGTTVTAAKIETIDTSRKTVVIDRICYSWEKPPSDSAILHGKKVLVPFWRFENLDQITNRLTLDAEEYRVDGVIYVPWTLLSGPLANSRVIIPIHYLDPELRERLIVDEARIYQPRAKSRLPPVTTSGSSIPVPQTPQTLVRTMSSSLPPLANPQPAVATAAGDAKSAGMTSLTVPSAAESGEDNVSRLLTTRKRRCSVTEIDHTTTYNFSQNKRCTFHIKYLEVVPTNSYSLIPESVITKVQMHCENRSQNTASIVQANRREEFSLVLRGKTQLHWRLPRSTYWPDHFRVNVKLYDQARCELEGAVYEMTAEIRNSARLEKFRAWSITTLRAYDNAYVQGAAHQQERVMWGNKAVIEVQKCDDVL